MAAQSEAALTSARHCCAGRGLPAGRPGLAHPPGFPDKVNVRAPIAVLATSSSLRRPLLAAGPTGSPKAPTAKEGGIARGNRNREVVQL
jgi:hypothetical protein